MLTKFSAIIDGISTKKDGTMSLKLGTQDMETIDAPALVKMANKFVYVAISELPIAPDSLDIPENLVEPNDKSPSQRLRSVLFKYWEQQGKKGDFDAYYKSNMEKFISAVKEKLT